MEIWYPEYHRVKATMVIYVNKWKYACGFISVNIKKYQHYFSKSAIKSIPSWTITQIVKDVVSAK
jgi:hypothetical protein